MIPTSTGRDKTIKIQGIAHPAVQSSFMNQISFYENIPFTSRKLYKLIQMIISILPTLFTYLDGIGKLVHDIQLFESQDTHALHQRRKTIGCTLALSIAIGFQEYLHELGHQLWTLIPNGWDKRMETVGYSFLDLERDQSTL